jgi:hypothetical protein
MAAPSPVEKVPDDLLSALNNEGPRLSECLARFFTKGEFPIEQSAQSTFSCTGQRPYTDPKSKSEQLAQTDLAVGVPTLVISVTWGSGRFVSTVYLPINTVNQPPLPLQ